MSLKGCIDDIQSFIYYHIYRVGKTYTQRKELEQFDTKNVLTIEQKREAKRFFCAYEKISIKYHNFYYNRTGVWNAKYIPNDFFFRNVDIFYGNKRRSKGLENKCLYEKLFPQCLHPLKYACRINGYWYNSMNELLGGVPAFPDSCELVVKQANGSCGGHGVAFVQNEREYIEAIRHIEQDIIIEYPLKQSLVLDTIYPYAVNTLRIITLLRKEDVCVCSVVLRMGVDGSRVDNKSSGGVFCGVKEDGRLKENGFDKTYSQIIEHPTSKVLFSDIIIPNYQIVIETAKKMALMVPDFRMVSWDFALNKDNKPVLIEANLMGGGITSHQLCNGPLFGEITEEVLDEVFLKDNRKSIYKKMI